MEINVYKQTKRESSEEESGYRVTSAGLTDYSNESVLETIEDVGRDIFNLRKKKHILNIRNKIPNQAADIIYSNSINSFEKLTTEEMSKLVDILHDLESGEEKD